MAAGNYKKVAVPRYEVSLHSSPAAAGTYSVTHCGDVKAVLQLNDAKGNAVGYKTANVAAMADGRYAINISTNGVDATGYTVTTTKGNAAYLTRLGIMAVTVNGTVVRDLQAEAGK